MIVVHHGHSSGSTLFGSEIPSHQHVVSLTIRRAYHRACGTHDWYHAEGDIVAEVQMTAAQYAAMIGAPNSGDGVPCTLHAVRTGAVELYDNPPIVRTQTEDASDAIRKAGEDIATKARATRESIVARLDGKVSAKLLKEVTNDLDMFNQHVEKNAPWYATMLREAAENMVSTVRTEVETIITSAATRLGFKTLGELSEATTRRIEQKDNSR